MTKKRPASMEGPAGTLERLKCLPYAGMPAAGDMVEALGERVGARDWVGVGLCVSALALRVFAKAHGKGQG